MVKFCSEYEFHPAVPCNNPVLKKTERTRVLVVIFSEDGKRFVIVTSDEQAKISVRRVACVVGGLGDAFQRKNPTETTCYAGHATCEKHIYDVRDL